MLLKIKNINYSVAIVSVMFAVPTLVLAASSGSSNKEISKFQRLVDIGSIDLK